MAVSRDDLTIQEIEITAAGIGNAVALSFPTRHNIFLVTLPATPGNSQYYVKLPSDDDSAQGDWAEFHVVNRSFSASSGDSLVVYDSDGNALYPSGPYVSAQYASGQWTATVRKVAPAKWRVIGA